MDPYTGKPKTPPPFFQLLVIVFLVPWAMSIASDGQLPYWRGVAGAVAFVLVVDFVVTVASVIVMKK